MVRILLVCTGGMSTSFLVQNMKRAASACDQEVQINAVGKARLEDIAEQADVILIAPQARFYESRVRQLCQLYSVRCGLIPPVMYGSMDGKAALDLALAILQEGGPANR